MIDETTNLLIEVGQTWIAITKKTVPYVLALLTISVVLFSVSIGTIWLWHGYEIAHAAYRGFLFLSVISGIALVLTAISRKTVKAKWLLIVYNIFATVTIVASGSVALLVLIKLAIEF